MGTTQRMAGFIAGAKYEDIPKPAVNLAKLCLLDAVGCAIYGTTRPLGKIMTSLVEELGGKPVARVFGTRIETNAVNAAMANGTLGHSEDFDDYGAGHQAVMLMPVVLALGEELHASGKQTLLSYAVGFDITTSVTQSMGEDHYAKGWHNTSSIGTLGSTAAAAKMLGLDEMQTRMALGIGATQASGLRGNFGTMTKPFHPGNGCRAGVTAAKLAQKGYEANPEILEHRFGYAAVYGEEMMHLSNIPRHLGNPWALMGTGREVANGISMKIWPCCGGTHGANTAMTHLLKKHPIKPDEVQSVDIVTTHEPSCMAPNLRWPKSGLQGKFSTWYTVSSMIVDGGKLDLSSFTDEAARRPAVQALLHKVNIEQDPEMVGRPHRARGGAHWWDVTVTLKNGERLVAPRVEANGGRGDSYGWESREAVFDKFRMLAGSVLKPSQVDSALNAIMSMEEAADIRGIVDTVVPVG
ncbi:MAG TPA: MmgE/PrpD family protein [Burkholderiales bacterium]|nr:MmgE/PrpD family protein [Burkholderiales bacterium]